MIYFLIGALVGFTVTDLAWPVVAALRRRLDLIPAEPFASPPASRSVVLRFILIAVILGLCLWLIADWRFLETEINVLLILGALFGLLLVVLLRSGRQATSSPEIASQPDGLANRPQRPSQPARDEAKSAPWWGRPSSLIPLALIVLPLLALVAPHGKLDLGFLRSVKTPFVEAQFAHTETELRFQLESEPQGFFQIDRDGLGGALHMARNERIFRRAIADATHASGDGERAEKAQKALNLLTKVLQPAALCAYYVDDLYGDREIHIDSLHMIGAGLAQALVLPVRSATDGSPPQETAQTTLVKTLNNLRCRLESVRPTLLAVSGPRAGDGTHPCSVDPSPAVRPDANEIMRDPMVVHAASMFFLWSGNPRAARRMVEKAFPDDRAPVADYPGLDLVRGFAKRWESVRADPDAYLKLWAHGIKGLEDRLLRLKQIAPAALAECERASFADFNFAQDEILEPAQDGTPPAACQELHLSARDCDIRLAYGYYTFWLQKLRGHLVYESARELMTGRSLSNRETILERALAQAKALAAFVDADGLRKGNCFTQQVVRFDDGGTGSRVAVTSATPDQEYALFLDDYGSMLVASALGRDSVDTDKVQTAIAEFEKSLRYAGNAGEPDPLVETIRDHRAQARRALGLADR